MSLAAGTKLDSYEILALLGAGGMGEVYRARDLALKREVAIKVLPSFVSGDPERLSRFEQEAQAAAALNHPNILAVHHFGRFDGSHYLVSELLEGNTLRQLLQHGSLPVRKAIDYGVQIAHGLAAAHDRGIVHRDLKPENLFVAKDGHVKILDFGLAKLMHREPDPDGAATTVAHGTDPGMVMGTAGYMSPEQVRGETVDHRTDIFAFGAILYEMLTGRRAFQRSTSAETMTAVLNEDPPAISQTGGNIPPALQRVVNRCLEKNPEQRFHSASDLAFALDALSDSGASPAVAAQAPSHRRAGRTVVLSIGAVAAILLAAIAYFAIANRSSGPPLRISEYTQLTHNGHAGYAMGTDGSRLYLQGGHGLPISQVSVSGGDIEPVSISVPNPALLNISPDGSTYLVRSYRGGISSSLPVYTVQAVGGSHRYLVDAVDATWSPDGKMVAYSTVDEELDVINIDGTAGHKIASVRGIDGNLNWSPDGKAIRFDRYNSIWEIASSGTNLHSPLQSWPSSDQRCCGRWSPDGKFYAFLGPGPAGPASQVYVLDERRGLFRRPATEPFQLTSGPIDWDAPIFSSDGKKMFATGATHAGELVRFDSKSNQFQPFLGGMSADLTAFSKDGQYVAYVSYPDGILWRANRDGSDRVQLTAPPLKPQSVAWSPDGSQLAFMAKSPEGARIWIVAAQGGSAKRLLPEDRASETDPSWSPDGRTMIFSTGIVGGSNSVIKILDLASHRITALPGSEGKFSPQFSPDGQSIKADSLDDSTLFRYDIKTQRWSTLSTGFFFAYATWSSDSRSLYFLRYEKDPAVLRVPAAGGQAKVVAGLKDFPFTGTLRLWFGLDPTDTPLMLRDVSTSDVYALTLEEK
jgi:eukaryotic-like serine/threonine-protein kinase